MHLHTDIDPSTIINISAASTTTITKPTTSTTRTTTTTTLTAPTSIPKQQNPFYFAYGSNLSPTQMAARCTVHPDTSIPLAIARLPKWRWLIHQRGYANVLPPHELRIGGQLHPDAEQVPVAGEGDAVYGVLYDMGKEDERILDGYEGVDWDAPVAEGKGGLGLDVRPREQGRGCYNKWVVEAEVVSWIGAGDGREKRETVPVLVYVDERRVRMGPPKAEYIPRMNRAIRESVDLGLPARWAEEVMRPSIPSM
ncbi:hypothetical protein BO94DRAFT_188541 [Aspergillus sclerotioniger CBS 115572]|uniref:gamma-glutamylcyclotransferase n=1 Tax=Aspergillus sclerotioniger CBS 115572 TaxID=1450535 RepID=A0A317VZ03_9EURO|nr:hypothetical protein BO94DRAFT_188541 [Aspergillus sclerotioniger CBS 115572]PWY78158.1 hypothetical protein BO94DRAFT_188541 [Aspergillus sclerotioniger CBS 115572]